MFLASGLAAAAATACLAGCASGGAARSADVSRPAVMPIATPAVAAVAAASPRPAGRAPRVEDGDTERHAQRSQLSAARGAARAFFETFVAYLSGRLPSESVADVSPALRAQLESGRAGTTPAERASHPRIGRVHAAIAGPPASVSAVAFVELGPAQRSQLTATLEPTGRTWRVITVGGY